MLPETATRKIINTMIDNTAYAKSLIRKQVEGTLTREEYVEWKLARLYYGEEEWFRLEVDVFCELEEEQLESETVDWRPLFAKAREREKQQERGTRRMAGSSKWIIAAILLATIGWAIKYHWDIHYGPLQRFGDCISMADTLIPAMEFRGVVSAGGAAPVTIGPDVVGPIARVGHLSVYRDPAGMLQIGELPGAVPPAAGDHRDIRIATGKGEQCGVRLPGGTVIRLNELSALHYPYAPDTAMGIRISGEAFVQVPPQESGRQVALETANATVYSRQGSFVVHAAQRTTSTTLLDGRLSVLPENGRGMEYATERADAISVTTGDAPDGRRQDAALLARHGDIDRVLQWARVTTDYRNVPLKEFIRREAARFGIKFGNLACLPDGKRINAALCYRATVDDFLAAVGKEGLRVYVENGVYTFCDPATGKPWARGRVAAALYGQDGKCHYCTQRLIVKRK